MPRGEWRRRPEGGLADIAKARMRELRGPVPRQRDAVSVAIDQACQELREMGLSYGEIAGQLAERYGVTMTRQAVQQRLKRLSEGA